MSEHRVALGLAPALTAAELARAVRWKFIYGLATYWHLQPIEVKRRIFIEYLIETGRIGKDDRN